MQIIVQFSNRNLNIKELCQAIKIFSKKHDKYNFCLLAHKINYTQLKTKKMSKY